MVNATLNQNFTAESVKAADCSALTPEFVRVPDVQRLFGIKRGILYRWIAESRIKSFVIREKGNKQGIRLIYLPSLRGYLMKQMEMQEQETQEMAIAA
jgi:hypothetical protein